MKCTECIDLAKGKKEAEDANGPLMGEPSFFKERCAMTEVIGVIYSMAEIEAIDKGFHVGKFFFCSHPSAFSLPSLSLSLSLSLSFFLVQQDLHR